MAFDSHIVTVRRLKKYIDDVIGKKANLPNNKNTIVGNLVTLNTKVNNLEPTKFTSLSPYLDRCSIVSGGYSVNGNIAYIDVIATLKVAIDHQAILQGFPMPKNRDLLPISGMASIYNVANSELSVNGYITPSYISDIPLLAIPYAIQSGATVHFTGEYIVSQS
jgi:hypothetical protein